METTIIPKTETPEPDWDFLELAWRLEKEWKEALRQQLPRTDSELLKVFQPSRQMLMGKIEEWQTARNEIVAVIKRKIITIKAKSAPESQWFWKEWLKLNEGEELLRTDQHITRLKRLLYASKSRTPSRKGVTQEMIERALSVPIENVLNQKLRRSGSRLVALCPLHNERTPSFFIYPDSNSFYCYGCCVGGNVINLVRLLQNVGFIEAVKYLTHE